MAASSKPLRPSLKVNKLSPQAFRERLTRIDRRLYVATDRAVPGPEGDLIAPIMLRRNKRDKVENLNGIDGAAARFMHDSTTGNKDEHIGSVSLSEVPEGDLFNEKGREIKRGWRTIARNLIKRGMEKRRVWAAFGRGIGESDYDRQSFEQRARAFAPKVSKYAKFL